MTRRACSLVLPSIRRWRSSITPVIRALFGQYYEKRTNRELVMYDSEV